MKKILITFGTRPEAIKMAPLVAELKKFNQIKICITSQHRSMLDQVLKLFNISTDYDLNIMQLDQDLFDVTSNIMNKMKKIISNEKPDLVLVHGDTTTALAVAMSCFYLKTPIGHIEAGLRTYDIFSPYPEEFNRQIISKIATLHFAPTNSAKNNLLKENIQSENIFVTGNTVIDALFYTVKKVRHYNYSNQTLKTLSFLNEKEKEKKIILVTGHRRENFGDGIKEICLSLIEIEKTFNNVRIIYPVHLNPNIQNVVKPLLSQSKNIFLTDPLDYFDFVKIMDRSYIILTDSGGVQEEAPSLGKPVLVLRNKTERPEVIKSGVAKLVGYNKVKIFSHVSELLSNNKKYKSMANKINPYGDGKASKIITKIISEELK